MKRLFVLTFAALVAGGAGAAGTVPATDRLALANRFARLGLHAEALREYESIRGEKGVPADEVLYGLAECCRKTDKAADALRHYGALVRDFPASRYAPYARLNVALAEKGDARLLALGELLKADTPREVRDLARFSLAPFWAESADPALRRKALGTYLDLALGKDSALAAEATFQAALLSYKEAKYEDAAKLFRRLEKNFPDSPRVASCGTYAAWSAYLAGRYNDALEIVTRGRGGMADATEDRYYLKAASLKALERCEEALAAYEAQLAAFPEGRYAETAALDRLFLRQAARDYAGVLRDLASHGDWSRKVAAQAYACGYEAAAAVTNFTLAIGYARRVAAAGGSGASRALYSIGVFQSRLGKGGAAIAQWTEQLAKYPDAPFAAEALAARAAEELRAGDRQAAYATYNELKRRFPERARDAATCYWHGVAARGAGDEPEAEKLLRAALAAKPDPETERDARLELAFLLEKRGATAESARLLNGLVTTKAVERMSDATLAWAAETSGNADTALALERRTKDPAYRQIAATLLGEAYAKKGMTAAAKAAYGRAVASEARTKAFARAALGLGRIESDERAFDAAKRHLSLAVEQAVDSETASLRLDAYMALAANEEARNDSRAALGYWLLAGSLFDDETRSPVALRKAADILQAQGKRKEAENLRAEALKRYGK